MSSIRPPEAWKAQPPGTLDILVFIRKQLHEGVMPELFFGRADVMALNSFADGLHFASYCQHRHDPAYMEFVSWLRDEKHEFPAGGGWAKKYLEDCQGDHLAAIHRFLDRVAEFIALRAPLTV